MVALVSRTLSLVSAAVTISSALATASLSAKASFAATVAQPTTVNSVSQLQAFEYCMDSSAPDKTKDSVTTNVNLFVEQSPQYEDFATGPKARIARRPLGVYFAQNEDDVVRAVKCSVSNGLAPVPRSGGHSYEVLSSMDGSLVIDMADMVDVAIVSENPLERTALVTVRAGARLGWIHTELDRLGGGYTLSAGTCPTVGIGGHISGGGYGMISRHFGLTADHTVAMRVVLYDGSVVTASATEHPDLFWALRGGGAGSFGIVTLFTLRAFALPQVSVFNIHFDASARARVLRAWMDFFPTADSRVTTQLNFEDNGGARLTGHFLGPRAELDALLDASGVMALQGLTAHERLSNCSYLGIKAYAWQATCDDLRSLNVSRHLTVADKDYGKIKAGYATAVLDDAGVQTVIDWADRVPGAETWTLIQFQAYGGVFATQSNDMTPWAHRDAMWSVQVVVGTQKGESEDSASYQWIRGLLAALDKYLDGGNYQNYCDLDLGADFGPRYWGAANFARLRQIKARYDPLDVFHSAQSVPLP